MMLVTAALAIMLFATAGSAEVQAKHSQEVILDLQERISNMERQGQEVGREYNEALQTIDQLEQQMAYREAAGEWEYSKAELEYVTRLVIAESGWEPYEGQVGVAQCVHDRLAAGRYGSTVYDVIDAPGQFATPYSGDLAKFPDASKAVLSVFLLGERAFDEDVIFFYNPKTSDPSAKAWLETMPYIGTIEHHVFRGVK